MLRPNGSINGVRTGEKPAKSIPVSSARRQPATGRRPLSLSGSALNMPCSASESDRASQAPCRRTPVMTNWPTEIRLPKDRKALAVSFDTGEHFLLPAEYLRVKSPSAEVQGH